MAGHLCTTSEDDMSTNATIGLWGSILCSTIYSAAGSYLPAILWLLLAVAIVVVEKVWTKT
jgi:hypothetical protein